MKYAGGAATKAEFELLDTLWDAEVPLTRADILARAQDKGWKDSSVHILLNGLLKKGLILEAGYARSGKNFGRTFAPAVTVEEYFIPVFRSLPARCREDLLRQLIQREDLTAGTIRAMLDILNNIKLPSET